MVSSGLSNGMIVDRPRDSVLRLLCSSGLMADRLAIRLLPSRFPADKKCEPREPKPEPITIDNHLERIPVSARGPANSAMADTDVLSCDC